MDSEPDLQSAAAAFKASCHSINITAPMGHHHEAVAGCSLSSAPVTGSGHLAVNIGSHSSSSETAEDLSIEALPSHAGWLKQARNV